MMPLDDRRGMRLRGRRPIMAQARALAIDGVPLCDVMCWLEDARLGGATPATALGEVPGRPGGIDLTLSGATGAATPGRRTCEFDIATDAAARDRAHVKFAVGAWAGREVSALYGPMGCELRGRLSVGAWEDAPAISRCTLSLDAEPFALGPERSSSAGRLLVGGEVWVEPMYELAVRSARPNVDLIVDGLRVLRVPSASGSWPVGALVSIDCAACSVKVNGQLACPTLDSDWPILTPGAHRVSCDGCDVTVTWRERHMF